MLLNLCFNLLISMPMKNNTSSECLSFGILRKYKFLYLVMALLLLILCIEAYHGRTYGFMIIWFPLSMGRFMRMYTYSLTSDTLFVYGIFRKKPLKVIPYSSIRQIVPCYLANGELQKLRISYDLSASSELQPAWIDVTSEVDLEGLRRELEGRRECVGR